MQFSVSTVEQFTLFDSRSINEHEDKVNDPRIVVPGADIVKMYSAKSNRDSELYIIVSRKINEPLFYFSTEIKTTAEVHQYRQDMRCELHKCDKAEWIQEDGQRVTRDTLLSKLNLPANVGITELICQLIPETVQEVYPNPLIRYKNQLITANDFDEIAEIILRRLVIKAGSKCYRVRELEMYLYNDDHLDAYTHRSPEQTKFAGIYAHRYANGSFKSGTYKCMDLTFGDSDLHQWFGILIRGLIPDGESPTDGPCLSVNHILQQYGLSDLSSYAKQCNDPNAQSLVSLFYVSAPFCNDRIIKGVRIGLSDKFLNYRDLPYRYGFAGHRYKKPFK